MCLVKEMLTKHNVINQCIAVLGLNISIDTVSERIELVNLYIINELEMFSLRS